MREGIDRCIIGVEDEMKMIIVRYFISIELVLVLA